MRPSRPSRAARGRSRRRGLAPLEFVAALPFVILLASLMLVVGGAGLVKSRAQINARYANWRSGSIRNSGDPNPQNWEDPALLTGGGGGDVTRTDQTWNADPGLQEPALRGSTVSGGGDTIRVDGVLEIGAFVHTGNAQYRRPLPLLRKVFPNKGEYDVDLTHEVLSDPWEYHEGPFELNNNTASFSQGGLPPHRRELVSRGDKWYEFQQEMIFPAMEPPRSALVGANLVALDTLDRDPELIAEFGMPGPDFHPRFPGPWLGLAGTAQSPAYQDHLDQVRSLPGTMANTFAGMYRQQIADRQAQIDSLRMGMPVDAAAIAQLEGEIAAIQAKLDPMERFLQALPQRNQ